MSVSAFNFFISATLSQLAALKASVLLRQMDAVKMWKNYYRCSFHKTQLVLTFRAETVLYLNEVVHSVPKCVAIDATILSYKV